MSTSSRRWHTLLASCFSTAFWLTACTAHPSTETPPLTFKTECVGRLQFALPEAEVAVVDSKDILRDLKGPVRISDGGISMATQFMDGQNAGYSEFTYEGQLMIASPVSEALFKTATDLFDKHEQSLRSQRMAGKVDEKGESLRFYSIQNLSAQERAWRFQWQYEYLMRVGDTLLTWSASYGRSDDKEVNSRAFNSLRATRARSLFTVPAAESGVCLPYLFVPDDGKPVRDIGVTYRIKGHPDVTVLIRDSSGGRRVYDDDSKMSTAHHDVRFFWNLNYSNRKSVVMKENHTFRLAGIEGEYSVVELTRKDDTIDYGYFASAIDDPEKIADPTNLQMFVIRDAQNAKAKGVEPMPKDEFIQLAKAIAATVQKRPVSASAARP